MPDEIKFAQLNALVAYDSGKVIAIQNDPVDGTKGFKGTVALDLTSPSDAKLVTQKAIADDTMRKLGDVAETITGLKTFEDLITCESGLDADINKIINVANPVAALDAVNKQTLDAVTANLTWTVTNFYVHINGSDVTGDGSRAYPFLTVQTAIDYIVAMFTPTEDQQFTVTALSPYNFSEIVDLTIAPWVNLDLTYCNFRVNTFIIGDNNIVTIGQLERLSGVGNVVQKVGTGASVLNVGVLKNDQSFGLIKMFNGQLDVYANKVLGSSRNATIIDFDPGASDSKVIVRANKIQGRAFTNSISSQFFLYSDEIDGDGDINPGADSIGAFIARKGRGNILNAGALSTVVISVLERDFVITQDNIDKDAKLITHQYFNVIGKGTVLLEGCEVTDGSTTQKYNVTEGWGVISNEYANPLLPTARLQYIPAVTDATDPYTTTAPFTGLTVSSGGVITPEAASIPEGADHRDKFLVGVLNHQDFTQITHIRTVTDGDASFEAIKDINEALGFLQVTGKKFKIKPFTNDTRLEISDGTFYSVGINGKVTAATRKNLSLKPLSGKSPMVIVYLFRDGLGGFLTWSTTTPTYPQLGGEAPQYWDDGTVVTPGNPPNGGVTSNQWTDQRHFKDGTFNQEVALFSQVAGYGNKTIALSERIVEEMITAEFVKFFMPIAERVIQNNASYNASNTDMAVTIPLNIFGAPSVI